MCLQVRKSLPLQLANLVFRMVFAELNIHVASLIDLPLWVRPTARRPERDMSRSVAVVAN